MYSSACTRGARCVYSGGRQCNNGARLNSGGGVLSAACQKQLLIGCLVVEQLRLQQRLRQMYAIY